MPQPATVTAAATRNRLVWQCRRGMRELDQLLHGFLDKRYAGLGTAQLATFATLLEYPDAVLLELLMGRMRPADKDVDDIVQEIRNAAQS